MFEIKCTYKFNMHNCHSSAVFTSIPSFLTLFARTFVRYVLIPRNHYKSFHFIGGKKCLLWQRKQPRPISLPTSPPLSLPPSHAHPPSLDYCDIKLGVITEYWVWRMRLSVPWVVGWWEVTRQPGMQSEENCVWPVSTNPRHRLCAKANFLLFPSQILP